MRKAAVILAAAALLAAGQAQAVSLKKIWETEKVFDTPESVIYDAEFHVLYVSSIGGSPQAKDGNGFISRVSMKGEILDLKWIKGLNGPKGMGIHGRTLYVADIDELVEIDIEGGRIRKRYPAREARFLNDVVTGADGTVYVSDSSRDHSAIYRLKGGSLEVWKESKLLGRPNGLAMRDGMLIVGVSSDGMLRQIDPASGGIEDLAVVGSAIDGVAVAYSRNLIVSDWSGRTMFIDREGGIRILLDTTESKINSADICYIRKYDMLLIPTFSDDRVVACRVVH
ncbi:MAG TPA: hypothetical protein VLA34_11455 [Candidatus Krumholzibacterium sp.]|nr:hypothetical protein [Candidatus Krumholzibacterium sp.]